MKNFKFNNIRQPIVVSVILLILCGFIFPVLMTGISTLIFPFQAKGSIIEENGEKIGSLYIGQDFTEPYFMKCRPSAYNYNTYKDGVLKDNNLYVDNEIVAPSSGSSNYAPLNPELEKRVENDIEKFLKDNPGLKKEDIPTDLFTQSGSGLDPHISYESAKIQIPQISKASEISEEDLMKIVDKRTEKKVLGIFGEDKVNVLLVNIDIAKTMGILK